MHFHISFLVTAQSVVSAMTNSSPNNPHATIFQIPADWKNSTAIITGVT